MRASVVDVRVSEALEEAKAQLNRFSRANPRLADLPEWVGSFRPWQREAVDDILNSFTRCDLVILDAPTGSGKTLIAETVRRLLGVGSCLYVCNSKSLQSQFLKDYPYGRLLQGRSNYPTQRFPQRFNSNNYLTQLSCADCTKTNPSGCQWCDSPGTCPYERAKREGLSSNLTVLNTAYFLTEANGPGRFSGRGLVVLDECDTLERELMSYVECQISPRRMARLGLDSPEKVTVASSWLKWLGEAIQAVSSYKSSLPSLPTQPADIRESKAVNSLQTSLRRIRNNLMADPESWVYTGLDNYVGFKPSHVASLAKEALWKHGKKFLLMSGSVISAEELIQSLGWESNYETCKIPSTFPKENRPVYVRPSGNMSRSVNDRAGIRDGIAKVLDEGEPGSNVLVHTVSYDLTKYLAEQDWDREVLSYNSSDQRSDILRRVYSNPGGGLLLAPSFDRGIDLPDDLCRIQIVAKVPFPNLGDRQVGARLHSAGGQQWYNVQTARSLIQMTGRGVRHKEDWCRTYILDTQFIKFWKQNKYLFPEWWADALVWRL
jgi:ATP-dependent DNA helicase DinG